MRTVPRGYLFNDTYLRQAESCLILEGNLYFQDPLARFGYGCKHAGFGI